MTQPKKRLKPRRLKRRKKPRKHGKPKKRQRTRRKQRPPQRLPHQQHPPALLRHLRPSRRHPLQQLPHQLTVQHRHLPSLLRRFRTPHNHQPLQPTPRNRLHSILPYQVRHQHWPSHRKNKIVRKCTGCIGRSLRLPIQPCQLVGRYPHAVLLSQ